MSDASAPRASILIADDSDVCRTVLAILLKNSGYDVTSVINGREAVAKLRAHPFDLALLDNDMPELDGLGTLAELRSFLPDLPVAIVSGTLSPAIRARYEALKIEAIYSKPVDPRKLRENIPAILEQRRRAPRNLASSADDGHSLAPFQVLGDADAALEKPVFAGNSAQVRKLVSDFGRIRDFRAAATVSGRSGAAFLDVAVAIAEERDAVLLACDAPLVSISRLTLLFAPALLHTKPVLLIVLNSERLDPDQQELLDNLISGGGALSAFNGRARVILCAEADLSALADTGEFNEMLLMRAGVMKLGIPALAQRQTDAAQIARAVLRRIGATKVRLAASSLAWIDHKDWPGDYAQLHRTVEIARLSRPDATELAPADLEAALARESTWTKPLYHDLLRNTLGA
jgi:DNA-binding NtrC family response regulator